MAEEDKDKGKTALIVTATGLSIAALIAALTKKAEAGVPPTDEEVRQALATILGQQVVTLDEINKIKTAIAQLPEGEAVMPVKIEQIPFVYDLEKAGVVGSEVTLEEAAPFDGYIKEVKIHWPDGCDHIVNVRVGRGIEQFCPREGFLALNDTTPTYFFNIPVKQGDVIWVEMINGDGANPHSITITVMVEGVT